jgi:tetratricopeptide (TPR) repeat protein
MTKRLVFVITLASALAIASSAPAQTAGTNAQFQALLGMARVKRDAGDVASARRYFEDARRVRAFDANELTEYFWVLAGHDARAALAVGGEVLATSPANRDVRDRLITESISLGDETSVVSLAEDGHRRQPETALWPRRLAESYQRQGMAAQAAAAFTRASQAADAVPQDIIGLALALEANQQFPEAVAAWERVPPSIRSGHDDWERSRLRVLARSGAPEAAALELDSWLRTHQADEDLRNMLVDLWLRAGQPAKALAALQPLPADPASADRWLRRRLAIAQGAHLTDVTIASIDALVSHRTATVDERRVLAEALLERGQTDRAASVLRALSARGSGCDERLLNLIDRIPGQPGTALLLENLAAPRCNDTPRWLLRGIDRAVAASDLKAALALTDRLPQREAQQPNQLRLTGQLRLWTGDPAGAVRALESALHTTPTDAVARETLVDAYRAEHNADAAWRTAEPLLDTALPAARLTMLAELALEANRPTETLRLEGRLPNAPETAATRAGLRGRALLALGRPADARNALLSIDRATMAPQVALALVDSTNAVSGPKSALDVARQFSTETTEWRDMLARRVLLEAVVGDADRAAALRRTLAAIDPETALIADAEVALAQQRPRDALAILSRLSNDPQSDRAADLEATSRAGIGDVAGAVAINARLLRTHAESVALLLRDADWRYRLAPTPEALARIVALPAQFPGNQDAALLAARTLAAVGRDSEALAILSELPTPIARDLRADLEASVAAKSLAAGDHDAAHTAAARAVDLNPANGEAWLTLVDASSRSDGGRALADVLQRFEAAPVNPTLTISMAEHLGSFVRSNDDPLVTRALSWLDRVEPADTAMTVSRDLARARLYATVERWSESLTSVDHALAADANSVAALKLRAEVLSWSGRHAEALTAYDRYLAAQPQDVAARRHQARVAGWGGQFSEAKRLYAALQAMRPDDAQIAAEVAAKAAFFDGRWRAAVDAYAHWIAVEPGDNEARFEYAEALRADGQMRAADAALHALQAENGHRLATAVLAREQAEREPAVTAIANQRSTNGYAGQRLLDLSEYGGALRTAFGQTGQTRFSVEGAGVRAAGGDAASFGYRAGVVASTALSPALNLDGRASLWDFSSASHAVADLLVRAAWRPADRWTVSAGADQTPLFENMTTVDRGITASGLFASATFESPRANVDVRLAWQGLSDGNARERATVTVTGTPSERLRQVRVVGWFESLS